ncbi:hypothetical protein L218DRAFT_811859, partial [Marasmius fiardii PR-910]
MSSSTLKLVHRLPTFLEDGGNWSSYKSRIENHAISKGLRRHLVGMAKRPKFEIEMGDDGKWYKVGDTLLALSDEVAEKTEDEWEDYYKKEAQTREFIYETVPQSIFIQIRDLPSAAAVWKKITSICEDRGSLITSDL